MTDIVKIMDIILTWQVLALKAAGYQIVPMEPTHEMRRAWIENAKLGFRKRYMTMLAVCRE